MGNPNSYRHSFCYLVGRLVFGAGHPAVSFLLLLAIADDAAGLIILAIFYPSGELAPEWLLLSAGAALLAYLYSIGFLVNSTLTTQPKQKQPGFVKICLFGHMLSLVA